MAAHRNVDAWQFRNRPWLVAEKNRIRYADKLVLRIRDFDWLVTDRRDHATDLPDIVGGKLIRAGQINRGQSQTPQRETQRPAVEYIMHAQQNRDGAGA